jgi:NitT/TauT family transport system ATP-binding protein
VIERDSAAPLVTLRGVQKTYASGVRALADVDLDIRRGEFLTLLGPSGCGKSTVLRLVAGLTQPTAGDIVRHIPSASGQPQIGFVFQEPTLTPWSNVFDNVWLPLRLRGVTRARARETVAQTLALVGLEGFADALPRELSGGMKMRVSIARALALRPSLLLMDEPFAALDEITRAKLNDDLLALKTRLAATIVFVTHSVYESAYLSSRIAVFSARPGRIVRTIEPQAPPRRDAAFRVSEAYVKLCRDVSHALELAMAAEDAS